MASVDVNKDADSIDWSLPTDCGNDLWGDTASPDFPRGDALRQREFLLESGTTFLNHGSYGTLPRVVAEWQQQLVQEMEANPDRWFRRTFRSKSLAAIAAVARVVGAAPADLVFVKNATAGVNAVLNTLQLGPEDACLITSQTYGACANAVAHCCARSGAALITLDVDRAALSSGDRLAALLEEALGQADNVKFALLDHITSPTAVILPVRRLCSICRAHGVPVLVDGAHAPGNVRFLGLHGRFSCRNERTRLRINDCETVYLQLLLYAVTAHLPNFTMFPIFPACRVSACILTDVGPSLSWCRWTSQRLVPTGTLPICTRGCFVPKARRFCGPYSSGRKRRRVL